VRLVIISQEAHQNAGIWHQAMEILFSNQSSLCLDVSFQQNCSHKKNAGKHFFAGKRFFCSQTLFLQANTFFQATLFIKKIANDKNLSCYVSQGDGGLKKNNPCLIKLVRESLFLHIYSMSNSLQNCEIAYKFRTLKLP
jgi:hypothetical protein